VRRQNRSRKWILVKDTPYVFACGNGVARQRIFAGVPLSKLRHIFITPAADPAVTAHMWIDADRVHFRGPLIVGKDLIGDLRRRCTQFGAHARRES
jgi:hypothetical protein